MGAQIMDLQRSYNGTKQSLDEEAYVFPATSAQEGFWYLDRLDPGNPAYNIALRFKLLGPLNPGALERSFNEIIRRHEVLRTTFADIEGAPVQVVAPALALRLSSVDLRQLCPADRDARCESITVEEGRRRFKLDSGPLLRVSLLRLGETDHILLITVHHIVADGWSTGVLIHEMGALYDAYCRGLPSPLLELPLQYGDVAVWQEEYHRNGVMEDQLRYWVGRLTDRVRFEVPTDHPRTAATASRSQLESTLLPTALTDTLTNLASQQGCTFFMMSLAALKLLLLRLTGESDLCIGSLTAGRSRVELEPLIGNFINPLALRTDLSGDPSFLELLARIRETVLDALAHQGVPFERVVEAARLDRDPGYSCIFKVNFIHQRAFLKPQEVSGVSIAALPSISPGALYDLNFIMVERAEGWRASCEYNADLYEAANVRQMLEGLRMILEGIAENPKQRLSEIRGPMQLERTPSVPADERDEHRSADRLHVAPRDETEAQLASVWEQVLGIEGIGVTEDFFDLGGHSLLAAKLVSQIERAFGRKTNLALDAFLRTPTIEAFAARLRSETTETTSEQVIAMGPEGSKPMLVLVDPSPRYRMLIRLLNPDQPVVGLVMPALADLPPCYSVEDVAEHLVRALLLSQPHGPYYLGGWCNAGVVAYEVAQQLRSRGEQVALLAMFDAWNPFYARSLRKWKAIPTRVKIRMHKMRYHFNNVRGKPMSHILEYLGKRVVALRDQLRLTFWRFWYRSLKKPVNDHVAQFGEFKHLAVEEYEPKPYDSDIVLILSETLKGCSALDPLQGWGKLIQGSVEVLRLPCDHGTLFSEPFVEQLAGKLTEYLPGGPAARFEHIRNQAD